MSLRNGLIGHWTMDSSDTSNGIIYDRSGYEHHGSISDGIETGKDGVFGESYLFDGNQEVRVSRTNIIDIFDTYSMCAWIYPTITTDDDTIMSREDETSHTNGWRFRIRNGSLDLAGTTNLSHNIESDQWYFVSATVDGDYGELYIDGELVDTDTSSARSGTTSDLIIGNSPAGPRGFTGRMHDVRFYNRVLTQEEIDGLYNIRNRKILKV